MYLYTEFVFRIWKNKMKVYKKLVIDMATGKILEEVSYEYHGPLVLCKVTDQEKNAASNLQQMTDTLKGSFSTAFAGQQAILDNIDRSIKATIAAGPSQYGFSAQQDAALRTQASEGTAGAYKMARQATGEALAARGGGNVYLPSGTEDVLKAEVANRAASQEASQQLGITEAGWQTGRQNYLDAVGIGQKSAQIFDPTAYSSQALSGARDTFEAQHQMATEPTTAGVVGGILGSVAGTALGGWASGGFKTPSSPKN
jgi:hypothetical protein